jgi:hypothetical protein
MKQSANITIITAMFSIQAAIKGLSSGAGRTSPVVVAKRY